MASLQRDVPKGKFGVFNGSNMVSVCADHEHLLKTLAEQRFPTGLMVGKRTDFGFKWFRVVRTKSGLALDPQVR